jgi:hypothetical protein
VSAISRIGAPAELAGQPASSALRPRLAGAWAALGDEAALGSPFGAQSPLGGPLGSLGAQGTLASLSRGALPPAQARAGAFSQALQTATLRTAPRAARASAAASRPSDGTWRLASAATGRTTTAAPRITSADAAGRISRIDQTDAREYDSVAQARLWGGSTCSATALTAVLRSRGISASIADVMRVMPGGITVERGLVSRPSLVNAAAKFGLRAQDNVTSYDALQQATAAGQPVLVDVTNGRFPEGHWLVVTGADARGVTIVDSSGYRLTSMSRDEFLAAWSKRGIRIMNGPQSQAAGKGTL